MKIYYSCLVILLHLVVQSVFGYNLRQITNENGLSNSAILSITQDSSGFMWFSTCDGLNIYNGFDIQVYKSTTAKARLLGNLIETVVETKDSEFWIRTNYGLNQYNRRTGNIVYHTEFAGNFFLRKDANNNLFVLQGDNQIFYYHQKSKIFKRIILEDTPFVNVLNIAITDKNKLWIFMNNGVSKSYTIQQNSSDDLVFIPDVLFNHEYRLINSFSQDELSDIVYIIDERQDLYECELSSKKKQFVYNLKTEISKNGIVSSILKHHNDYFIGFQLNGLLRLKKEKNTDKQTSVYAPEDIDIKAGIFCLFKDKQQDLLWIGTDGQGVYMYSNDAYIFKSTTFNSLSHKKIEKPIRAIFFDSKKNLWIGTKGDGIIKISNYDMDKNPQESQLEFLNTSNTSIQNNAVYAFGESKKDVLWIGNEDGLCYYSYQSRAITNLPLTSNGLNIKYIHSICELNDSTLWVASVGMGIAKISISWNGNTPKIESIKRIARGNGDTSQNYFFTIYKENDSTLYFGNRGHGAFWLNTKNEKLISFNLKNENEFDKTSNDIFSITKDYLGNYWMGTSSGLIKYDGQQYKIFSEKDGFLNSTVHGILKDSDSNIWLSTNSGIIRFNAKNETFETYHKQNGLKVIEYSDGAFFKDKNTGIMFFGGINGFTAIKESEDKNREYISPINFYNLTILGKDSNIFDFIKNKDGIETLELDYDQNIFSISFTALDYISGNNYSYQYKLNEISKEWINNGAQRTISFTNISPGTYTLYVRYLNNATGKESPIYTLLIKINPPWYLSIWAYIIYSIIIIFAAILGGRTLLKKNRQKRTLMLEKLEKQHQEEVYESKLHFFTSVAQEFCTPLTLISGPCSRILTHKDTDKFVETNTLLIQRNAERLNTLIQELIEFRQIETGNRIPQIEDLNISDLIQNIIDSFSELSVSRNITIAKNIHSTLKWNSDKRFLYTIISNLISNAFFYTKNGEIIKISVVIDETRNSLLLKISMSGRNISKNAVETLFDKTRIIESFENSDANSRNELGLAITHKMIDLLGGQINVEKAQKQEADITVTLPFREENVISTETNIPTEIKIKKDYEPVIQKLPNYIIDKNKNTVLIIDDDLETLWLICEILVEDFNVIPITEPIGEDFLLKELRPNVIICNALMEGMDGVGFIKQIKSNKHTSHISTILISAKQSTEEQIEGLAAGADIYIVKPFNLDYLKVSVKHLISRKETLKDYFSSPLSAFEFVDGKLTHRENQKFMQSILETINNNITNKDLSPTFIASELNISTRHLYRKIKEIGEQSVADLIKECRLHVANNLLLNTKLTIDEVIYKSGFSNRATFFKTFSNKYKCTPKEYRDLNLKNLNNPNEE